MRRKKEEPASEGRQDGRLTPMDVQQVEFRLAFRGYSERDVDAFLDRVTEDLSAYIEENERLRGTASAAADDPSEARREAEEIVARARERAASIIREAEAPRIAAAGSAVDARAALAPFLGRERGFLESLGTLVQGHAEEIKGMVMALRARTEPMPDTESSGSTSEPEAAGSTSEPETAGSTDEADEHPEEATINLPDAGPASASEEQSAEAKDDSGVVSSEAPEAAAVRRDSGERSLRDLFWGED